jgi:hypothetical protein
MLEVNSRSCDREVTELECSVPPQQSTVLSHFNPVRVITACFCKPGSVIILPSTPRSRKWSLPLRFSDQNYVCISHSVQACFMSLRLDVYRPNCRCEW